MRHETEQARRVLIESGWKQDYYYVIRVMNSCMNTCDKNKAAIQLSIAFSWGIKQLANKLDVLRDKYLEISAALLDEAINYECYLLDIKRIIQDKIDYGRKSI